MRPDDLDPERWRRVRLVFEAAMDADSGGRASLVDEMCGGDAALRAEVMDLLEAAVRLEFEETTTGRAFLERAPVWGPEEEAREPPFHWGLLEVLEEIGAGGFGRVYRAHDPKLRRDVALKLQPVQGSGPTGQGDTHLEEARRLARVRHPNVLVVHGAEVHDGWAGIWTDLVPGETLDILLQRTGPFASAALLRAGVDLCRALEAVHDASLVHGDVKPSNAMRDADGRVLLMDFGSGRSASASSGDASEGSSGDRARQGTPVAMAPELLEGATPSVASDLYAMGVLLYRLASAQYPFRASGIPELKAALRAQEPIPLDELRPDLPTAFTRVVHRALAPDPGKRPATAAELRWLIAASLGADEPVCAEPEAGEDHLPRFTTRFVGRAAELRQLRALLAEPGLVTVAGPGGCGKTRLALQLARELHRSLAGGAVWVDLSSLDEQSDVALAAARSAGIRDEAGQSTEASLSGWVGARPVLLVLDNAEHVSVSAALCAAALLRACPNLRLLVTTRKRLSLEGERTLRLAPMAVPAERGGSAGLEILESDAVRLFLDRAQRGGEDLRLTHANAPDVARIVRSVEGIPLAVELAAARVATLGLSSVVARLEESFRLLAAPDRSGSKRHATLAASIAWSHDLLKADEARLFARLSVFAGGASLAAIETVCADPGSTPAATVGATDVVDLLSSLVEHSLVSVDSAGSNETRYRLLEMVRAFAALRLEESGEAEAARDRHVDWIEGEIRTRGPGTFGPEVHLHLAWFDREHGNLRSALQRLQGFVRAGVATSDRWMSACTYIRPYWHQRGHLREGLEMYQAALRFTPEDSRFRGVALSGLSALHRAMGDIDLALERATEAAQNARATKNLEVLASSLSMLASVYTDRGDLARARAHFEEALAVREEAARGTENSAFHAGVTAILCNLGVLEASFGDLAAAQAWYERALAHAKQHRDDSGMGTVSANLALTLFERGHHDRARALAGESLRTIRRSASLPSLWVGIRPMVLLEIAEGRLLEARGYVIEGLTSLGPAPHLPAWIGMLETAADLLVARGRASEATEILGAIAAARERSGVLLPVGFRPRWVRREDQLRETLGAEGFGAAWVRGRTRTAADAVDVAFGAI